MLFRRIRERLSGVPPQAGPLSHRVQLLRWLEARIPSESYLEIGCNRNGVFKQIHAAQKVGVDPQRGGTHRMTSDEFFAQNEQRFDLIFVDGLHHADQVMRDAENALAVLEPHGAIVLHDCNPLTEEAQIIPQPRRGVTWNGDVWKAIVLLRTRPDVDLAVGDFDHGCGVLLPRPNSRPLTLDRTLETLSYAELDAHREEWLNLLGAEALLEFTGLGKQA
jgi:hypothetical protein